MRRLAPLALALSVASAFISAPATSFAQPKPAKKATEDAAVLKKQGDEAMLRLGYQDALAFYEQAFALSKDPALHYNRGRALEALGRFPEALAMFEAFVREAPPDLKSRVPKLEELVDTIRLRVAVLSLRTVPAGASVRLGDAVIGETPLSDKQVNAGKVKLEITADGYEPLKQDLELKGGKKTDLALSLVPKDKQGTLVVRASVAGAAVEVDGKPVGRVPAELRLPPGSHEITVDLGGFEEEERTVVISTGQRKEVDVTLRELPEVYETWWFWTILGGGVATGGAIGLGYALSTERAPGEGDIEPKQIPIDPATLGVRLGPAGFRFVLPLD
jgi:hypothetical protein